MHTHTHTHTHQLHEALGIELGALHEMGAVTAHNAASSVSIQGHTTLTLSKRQLQDIFFGAVAAASSVPI